MNETLTQTFEEAVLKTVMFWSDKSFRTTLNQNNGDNSEHGAMAWMLMNMSSLSAQESVTEDKIKLFESKLTELLMEVKNENTWKWELDVDYHPCKMLTDAAEFAGLNSGCFPIKTFTRICPDFSVDARYQYGGKFQKL
jgi:hypothetical protein